jgi:hypothetical protein
MELFLVFAALIVGTFLWMRLALALAEAAHAASGSVSVGAFVFSISLIAPVLTLAFLVIAFK